MKFLKADVIVNELGQQFYVVNDIGDLRLITNDPNGLEKEFRLVANVYPEMTGASDLSKEYPIVNGEEEDMHLKDIIEEESKITKAWKKGSYKFMDESDGDL